MFRGLSGTARRWRSAAVGGRGMEERMKVPRRTDGTAATTTTTTTWSTSWLTRQSISGAKQTAVVHQTIYHLTTRGVHTRTPGLNIRERAHNNINIVAVDLSPLPRNNSHPPIAWRQVGEQSLPTSRWNWVQGVSSRWRYWHHEKQMYREVWHLR